MHASVEGRHCYRGMYIEKGHTAIKTCMFRKETWPFMHEWVEKKHDYQCMNVETGDIGINA